MSIYSGLAGENEFCCFGDYGFGAELQAPNFWRKIQNFDDFLPKAMA
jgi:hypothetical protein